MPKLTPSNKKLIKNLTKRVEKLEQKAGIHGEVIVKTPEGKTTTKL